MLSKFLIYRDIKTDLPYSNVVVQIKIELKNKCNDIVCHFHTVGVFDGKDYSKVVLCSSSEIIKFDDMNQKMFKIHGDITSEVIGWKPLYDDTGNEIK